VMYSNIYIYIYIYIISYPWKDTKGVVYILTKIGDRRE
jgi:hypothetical protein